MKDVIFKNRWTKVQIQQGCNLELGNLCHRWLTYRQGKNILRLRDKNMSESTNKSCTTDSSRKSSCVNSSYSTRKYSQPTRKSKARAGQVGTPIKNSISHDIFLLHFINHFIKQAIIDNNRHSNSISWFLFLQSLFDIISCLDYEVVYPKKKPPD